MEKVSQRAVIRYLLMKRLSPKEVFADMTKVLGEESAPSYEFVKKCARIFRRGKETLEEPRKGRPSTAINQENIGKINDMIMADRTIPVQYMAAQLGISKERVRTITNNHLKLTKVKAHWVPKASKEGAKDNGEGAKKKQVRRNKEGGEDDPRKGRPSMITTQENIRKIYDMIMTDRTITEQCIAKQLGISKKRVGVIINNHLKMIKVSAHWVPYAS